MTFDETVDEEEKKIIITEPIRGKYAQLADAGHFTILADTERTQGGTYLDARVFDERGEEWRRWMDLGRNIVFLATEENLQILNTIERLKAEEKVLELTIREHLTQLTSPVTRKNVAKHFIKEDPDEMRMGDSE